MKNDKVVQEKEEVDQGSSEEAEQQPDQQRVRQVEAWLWYWMATRCPNEFARFYKSPILGLKPLLRWMFQNVPRSTLAYLTTDLKNGPHWLAMCPTEDKERGEWWLRHWLLMRSPETFVKFCWCPTNGLDVFLEWMFQNVPRSALEILTQDLEESGDDLPEQVGGYIAQEVDAVLYTKHDPVVCYRELPDWLLEPVAV